MAKSQWQHDRINLGKKPKTSENKNRPDLFRQEPSMNYSSSSFCRVEHLNKLMDVVHG